MAELLSVPLTEPDLRRVSSGPTMSECLVVDVASLNLAHSGSGQSKSWAEPPLPALAGAEADR